MYDIVIPTIGRPSLKQLLAGLAKQPLPGCRQIFVVDDRKAPQEPLQLPGPAIVLVSGGRGPAAARNVGWRSGGAPWVVFLDDDVLTTPEWAEQVCADLLSATTACAGVQGRLIVPLPGGRRPTDWERNVAGLQDAKWATADMAYRRDVLAALDGFDERFPRAFREDADFALRVLTAGHQLAQGQRMCLHPVRPAGPWVSVRLQRGNADDALMRALHGRRWRREAVAPGADRMALHLATSVAATSCLAWLAGRRYKAAAAGSAAWAAFYTEFVLRRVLPGPKTPEELGKMLVTSALIPPVAVFYRSLGFFRWLPLQLLRSKQPL